MSTPMTALEINFLRLERDHRIYGLSRCTFYWGAFDVVIVRRENERTPQTWGFLVLKSKRTDAKCTVWKGAVDLQRWGWVTRELVMIKGKPSQKGREENFSRSLLLLQSPGPCLSKWCTFRGQGYYPGLFPFLGWAPILTGVWRSRNRLLGKLLFVDVQESIDSSRYLFWLYSIGSYRYQRDGHN